MAEEFIELGLEGFDRLVDKYHDKAYDTATSGGGRIWKKVHLPGRKGKSVFVEQNAPAGEKPETYDPAKDQIPQGFKLNKSSPRNDRGNYDDGYPDERERPDGRRAPSQTNERDYFTNDNLDSARKPYPNERSRGSSDQEYPPQGYQPPPPQGVYYPPPPRAPINDYGQPPPRQSYDPGRYPAPAVVDNMIAQNRQPQYGPENRLYQRGESPDQLGRRRSYDRRSRRDYDDDADYNNPPRRRRPRSEAPRDRREPEDDKKFALGVGLAGALAGGLLGRQLGKGNLVTTAAGAVVGALSGDIYADGRAKKNKVKASDRSDKDNRSDQRFRDYDRKDKDYDLRDKNDRRSSKNYDRQDMEYTGENRNFDGKSGGNYVYGNRY